MRHQMRRIHNIDIELREKSWDDIEDLSKIISRVISQNIIHN